MIELIAGICPIEASGLLGRTIAGTEQAGLLAQGVGMYIPIIKMVAMLILIAPWAYSSTWVHRDSKHVRAPKNVWSTVMLAVGGVGFLLWMILPAFAAGVSVYLVALISVLVAFLIYRNGRVGENEKISLTALLMGKGGGSKAKVVTKLKMYGANNQLILPPDPETAEDGEIEAYNLTQSLLYEVLWHRASEADVAPAGQMSRVRFVIDGMVNDQTAIAISESESIIQYLKGMAKMDVEERRRPQTGRITADLVGAPIDVDLAVAGKTTGQRLRMRIVQEYLQTNINLLGMDDDMLKRIREITAQPTGLFIVSGRPGSGITSTVYSLLRDQDAFIKQLTTLENNPEIDMENITQNSYDDAANMDSLLATTLRRDPDILMVDRCKDPAAGKRLAAVSENKAIMLAMQAGDSFTALAKWVKLCGDPGAVKHLRGVLCQILLRKLCLTCREAYKPDPQLLAKVNIPINQAEVFYRPPSQPLVDEKGKPYTCHTCQGSGYVGRTAAFELLEIDDDILKLILSGGSLSQIKTAARKKRMLYLQEQALRKVIAGETSIQEVVRVSQRKK